MKPENLNNKSNAQALYTSPDVKVVVINVQRVLCGSNEPYGNENYNPWA